MTWELIEGRHGIRILITILPAIPLTLYYKLRPYSVADTTYIEYITSKYWLDSKIPPDLMNKQASEWSYLS